ncbi:MAG: aspartate--tRNA ligase [Acidobacteria bacterium]|nr:aspartate--tRNA ligase [Acidobacteriota bacterium]MCB9396473.1 aspartate--tRNA ligase [Acidobacteriota bacterium]
MLDHLGSLKRTHDCGALRPENDGNRVTLLGWVAKRRDLGALIFIDVRDRYGVTQVLFNPEIAEDVHNKAKTLRSEFVIAVSGIVRKRDPKTVNAKLATGEIEIYADQLHILNTAATPPFPIEDNIENVGEELRLKYRFLDLRRPKLQNNFILRHKIALTVRNYLDQQNFLELETPMLTKSTPEGARDFLVPSRVQKGRFYALPQSPQIFKQLFMVSGFERYVQITRCFRDEDLRADRQPEFTQIDMEMSFVQREDVFAILEGMMTRIFQLVGEDIQGPFPQLSYAEAMNRYGSDKPDTRFGVMIEDFSEAARTCGFKVFSDTVSHNGVVKGLCAPGAAGKSRKDIETLETWLKKDFGISGLAWLKWGDEGFSGPILKFLGEELVSQLFAQAGGKQGDLLLLVAGPNERTCQALGALRLQLGKDLQLIDESKFAILWVVDFPLLELDAEAGRYVALHHPFTSPLDEDLEKLESNPGEVRAKAYDLVLNGFEIGGGSIRIHRRDVQSAMFKALGLSPEEAQEKFGFLLDALSFGAPPHGGIALGLDRITMILSGEKSLREVIAFPKTTSATCMMTESPSEVSVHQLLDLGIQVLRQG